MTFRPIAPLLALLLSACTAKDDDTAGSPSTESDCANGVDDDGDGATDCADDDCDCEGGGPDTLVTSFQVGLSAGAISQSTYGGDALPNTFTVALIDSASWTGWGDTDHGCALTFAVDGAATSAAWDGDSDAWHLAWDVDTTAAPTVAGSCDAPGADAFGGDVAAWVAGFAWAFAFSDTIDPDIEAALAEAMGADFDAIADSTIGAWTGSDYPGPFGFHQVNYGIVYAVDESGELLVDGDAFVYADTHATDAPPDGYYYASAWFGWTL